MSNTSTNPLSKHFRQPALYLKLPSLGRWYPEGALELPATGEIPVYPMTARDELTFKTPDALMNGSSTVSVIESCCPSIKDAWKMPAVDLDPILIAIRIASYGKGMDFKCVCPHCKTDHEKTVDLSYMLEQISPVDWSSPIFIDNLEIILKPQHYEDFNKNNMINFDEQRMAEMVQNNELSIEEKTQQFNDMFRRLIETGIKQLGKSIASIKTSTGTVVTDQNYISEFLDNCDRSIWEAIKNRLDEIRKNTNYNEITISCENEQCTKEFITPFVFEQSNFFD